MDIIHQVLPMGPNEWESVESDCNTHCPEHMRLLDNLCHQFNKQHKKKAPTGDPNIPRHVRIAKTAQWETIAKGNAVTLGEDSDTDNDSVLALVDDGEIVEEEEPDAEPERSGASSDKENENVSDKTVDKTKPSIAKKAIRKK